LLLILLIFLFFSLLLLLLLLLFLLVIFDNAFDVAVLDLGIFFLFLDDWAVGDDDGGDAAIFHGSGGTSSLLWKALMQSHSKSSHEEQRRPTCLQLESSLQGDPMGQVQHQGSFFFGSEDGVSSSNESESVLVLPSLLE
jgi:hypothetical protein